jgi:molybdopterin converting factor small subunit
MNKIEISPYDYEEAFIKIKKKFKKFTNMSLDNFNIPNDVTRQEAIDIYVKNIVFWNLENEKISNMKNENEDMEIFSQIYVIQQLRKQLEQKISTLDVDMRNQIMNNANIMHSEYKAQNNPLTKERQKEINDSFLPDELKNQKSKPNSDNKKKNKKKKNKKK